MTIMNGNFTSNDQYGVYIANLGAYNSGILHGSWLRLPATPEEIENCMINVFPGTFSGDYDREFSIHDYQLPFRISESEGIEQLNDQIERLTNALDSIGCDNSLISHLSDHEYDLDTIIEAIEDGRVRIYWGCETVSDIVQEMYDDGCIFHGVPYEVMSYFDWDRYARDYEIEFDGFFVERVRDLGHKSCVIEFSYR